MTDERLKHHKASLRPGEAEKPTDSGIRLTTKGERACAEYLATHAAARP